MDEKSNKSQLIFTEISDFKGIGKAISLCDGVIELVVTIDVGPRIIRFTMADGKSILEEQCDVCDILPDGSECRVYGGHRLCHCPEAFPRSYISDSYPLESYKFLEDGILLKQKEEAFTHIQKVIEIHFQNGHVKIVNKLINNGAWPVQMSAWSLTVCSRAGREVCPVVRRDTGFLPNAHYVLWPYSKLNDSRVHWEEKYIVIDNDPVNSTAFKFGYPNELGWAAYFNQGLCFIKKFSHHFDEEYPDRGCSYETYTSYWGTEMETLSPLKTVQPGEVVVQEDEWYLFYSEMPDITEESIARTLACFAGKAGITLP